MFKPRLPHWFVEHWSLPGWLQEYQWCWWIWGPQVLYDITFHSEDFGHSSLSLLPQIPLATIQYPSTIPGLIYTRSAWRTGPQSAEELNLPPREQGQQTLHYFYLNQLGGQSHETKKSTLNVNIWVLHLWYTSLWEVHSILWELEQSWQVALLKWQIAMTHNFVLIWCWASVLATWNLPFMYHWE